MREEIGVLIGISDELLLLGQGAGTGGARTAGRGLDGCQCLGKDDFRQSQHALVAVYPLFPNCSMRVLGREVNRVGQDIYHPVLLRLRQPNPQRQPDQALGLPIGHIHRAVHPTVASPGG